MSTAARQLLLVVAFGLCWHALWAASIPGPTQWDSAYTWEVARNLARGDGAVTRAVWAVAWLPPDLQHPADLHWSPLPSRILVPAMAVWPSWRMTQAVAVLLAALWGPLGWAWGRRLGLFGTQRVLAGIVAASGLGALPFLGVPDSVGLFGLLGGAALLTVAEGRLLATVVLCVLAALSRGDGFLLGLACAAGFTLRRAPWPALAGTGTAGLWMLRGWLLAGDGFFALRARVATAGSVGDLLLLQDPAPLGLGERLVGVLGSTPLAAGLFVLEGGVLPVLFGGLALLLRRRDRTPWPVLLLPPLVLLADFFLAPGVAGQGTTYRTLAAVLPALAALGLVGARDVLRDLSPWLLPGVVAVGGITLGSLVGVKLHGAFAVGDDCAALAAQGVPAGAPVLAYEPLHVTARCDHPALQIPPDATSADIARLADRYGIVWAVTAPEDHKQAAWRTSGVAWEGWVRVGERVWRRE